jgi:hypothetical protein
VSCWMLQGKTRIQKSIKVSGSEGMTGQWQHMQRQFHLPFPPLKKNCHHQYCHPILISCHQVEEKAEGYKASTPGVWL